MLTRYFSNAFNHVIGRAEPETLDSPPETTDKDSDNVRKEKLLR